MSNRVIGVVLLVVLASGVVPHVASSADLTGRDIAVMVDERPDGDDRRGTMTLTLTNSRGKTRVRTVTSFDKDYGVDTRTLMYFEAPADVKGTGFLQFEYEDPERQDDKWLYMPALKRARRIAGSSKNEYFMGTDFTYDDLGDRSVDEDMHELLRREEFGGHECWVVEAVPVDEGYMYSRVVRWIREDILLPARVEFYERQGELLKILTVVDVREVDGFWSIYEMEMENVLEEHRTTIVYEDLHYNVGLSDNLFKVSTLERGRIQ
jgi:hypothetical protein